MIEVVHTGYIMPWDAKTGLKSTNIHLYSSPLCWWSSAGGILVFTAGGSMVHHCSTAVEDGGLEAAADGNPPQCCEKASDWRGSVHSGPPPHST